MQIDIRERLAVLAVSQNADARDIPWAEPTAQAKGLQSMMRMYKYVEE